MNTLITIREASDLLGVSIKTLRRWEQQGKIVSIRTRGGHRRFRPEDLLQSGQATPLIIGYARVNRPEQNWVCAVSSKSKSLSSIKPRNPLQMKI